MSRFVGNAFLASALVVAGTAYAIPVENSGLVTRDDSFISDIYWLDNKRVIVLGAQSEAVPKEREYKLYVWDVEHRTITVHHDGGEPYATLCVHRGYVRYGYRRGTNGYVVFSGDFGHETTAVRDLFQEREGSQRDKEKPEVNSFSCTEYFRSRLQKLGSNVVPLVGGDYAAQDDGRGGTRRVQWIFFPADKPPIPLGMQYDSLLFKRFSEYGEGYVVRDMPSHYVFSPKIAQRYWLVTRQGQITDINIAAGPWFKGSVSVMPARGGNVMFSHAVDVKANGAAGVYWVDQSGVSKLVEGLPSSFAVSPDGCRVAFGISDFAKRPLVPLVKAIDVCEKDR
jgi:hypothetical protein